MRGWTWILLLVLAVVAVVVSQAQRVREFAARLGSGWANLSPDFRDRWVRAIERVNLKLVAAGDELRLAPFEGFRTVDRQREIMKQEDGATRVKDPLDSYHVWGLAGDAVFVDKLGRWVWPAVTDARWKLYGDALRANGLIWGRDWDGDGVIGETGEFDAPHAQLAPAGQRLAELKAIHKTPERYLASIGVELEVLA